MVSVPESHLDLVTTGQTVILATNGADGFPQVTAVWFFADEQGNVQISLNSTRQKVSNLQRSSQATLFFQDSANPYRTLEIRAQVDVQPDPDYVFAGKVGAKYGADVRDNDRPGESRIVASFTPVKINTFG